MFDIKLSSFFVKNIISLLHKVVYTQWHVSKMMWATADAFKKPTDLTCTVLCLI